MPVEEMDGGYIEKMEQNKLNTGRRKRIKEKNTEILHKFFNSPSLSL